jgi:hypothetical protein
VNRIYVIVVTLVASLGIIAGGVMVWAHGVYSGVDAIAKPVIGKPTLPVPPPQLIDIDEDAFALDGFALGMNENDILIAGQRLELRFRGKKRGDELVELIAVPDEPGRLQSVKLLSATGEIVAMRFAYTTPQSTILNTWKELLPEPYYSDDDLHWETTSLQVKARPDASRFYVARKAYRGRFTW